MKLAVFLQATLFVSPTNSFAQMSANDIVKKANLKRGLGNLSKFKNVSSVFFSIKNYFQL